MLRFSSVRLVCCLVYGLGATVTPPVQAQPPEPPPYAAALQRISIEQAHEIINGQTSITLHYDAAAPQMVCEDLFRQAGITVRNGSSQFWAQRTTPLTIHVQDQPFWAVVHLLEEKANILLYRISGESGYSLTTGDNEQAQMRRGPSLMRGSFLVMARSINWQQTRALYLKDYPPAPGQPPAMYENSGASRTLSIEVLADPKFRDLFSLYPADVEVEEAVDEKGQSLLTPSKHTFDPIGTPLGVQIPLERPNGMSLERGGPQGSRKIARIKGKMLFFLASRHENWSVPNPFKTLTANRDIFVAEGRERYSFSLDKADNNSYRLQIHIVRERIKPENYARAVSPRQQEQKLPRTFYRDDIVNTYSTDSMRLVYGDEYVQQPSGVGGGGSTRGWRYDMRVYPRERNEAGAIPDPVELIWSLPLEFKVVEVPFEFSGLPLP